VLLAEDALPLLLEELGRMPVRDRRAILARLSPDARARVERLSAVESAIPVHSTDIGARVAALRRGDHHGLTTAAAEALRRLLDIPTGDVTPRTPQPGASLVDSLAGMFRRPGAKS
jgi:hypothetical protein